MQNPINYSIRHIMRNIPNRILNEAFMKDLPYTRSGVRNLESRIKTEIIDNIVKPDCDIVGGRELKLDISGLSPISVETDGLVYKIPTSMTGGAAITSAEYASFVINATAGTGFGTSPAMYANTISPSPLANTLSSIMNASSPDPVTGTADCHVMDSGVNTVFIKAKNRQKIYWLLVQVENDDRLNQLSPKSYPDFAKLCLFAAKAWIYNKLIIEIDEGKIQGGAELGTFKNILDSYSDAAENYNEWLIETMEVVFMLNDPRKSQEFHFFITGGRRF